MFVENITWTFQKAEIKIPWTKEQKKRGWAYVNIHCSCVPAIGLSGEEKRELEDSELEQKGPRWRSLACSFCALKKYVKSQVVVTRRKSAPRKRYKAPDGARTGSPVFLTHKTAARGISAKTLRSRIKAIMLESGVNEIWSAHSCRGAVVSKLFNLGFSIKRCMEFGRWKSDKAILEHYLKEERFREKRESNNSLPSWEVLRLRARGVDEAAPR
jgi:hypothetical protein